MEPAGVSLKESGQRKGKQMNTSHGIALTFLALTLTAFTPAGAAPGYHINTDASAKKAVQQYADNNFQFDAVVYQAYLDKNLWRLAIASHDYLKEKPKDPVRECSFAQAYWKSQQPGIPENVPLPVAKELRGWFEEAVRDTEEAVKKLPKSIYANLTYGDYLQNFVMGMEKVPAMLHAYQQAVALAPELGYAHYKLAMGYFCSGNNSAENEDKVLAQLKKALVLDPRLTESYFSMAGAYWQKGDYKNVKRSLHKYLALHPEQASRPDIIRTQQILKQKLGS
jgi:tetratricopeptide (TPR) repeat protein